MTVFDPDTAEQSYEFAVRIPGEVACLHCNEVGENYRSEDQVWPPPEGTLIVCDGCHAVHAVVADGIRLATQSELDDNRGEA